VFRFRKVRDGKKTRDEMDWRSMGFWRFSTMAFGPLKHMRGKSFVPFIAVHIQCDTITSLTPAWSGSFDEKIISN
jgi:hypothetical protein